MPAGVIQLYGPRVRFHIALNLQHWLSVETFWLVLLVSVKHHLLLSQAVSIVQVSVTNCCLKCGKHNMSTIHLNRIYYYTNSIWFQTSALISHYKLVPVYVAEVDWLYVQQRNSSPVYGLGSSAYTCSCIRLYMFNSLNYCGTLPMTYVWR